MEDFKEYQEILQQVVELRINIKYTCLDHSWAVQEETVLQNSKRNLECMVIPEKVLPSEGRK